MLLSLLKMCDKYERGLGGADLVGDVGCSV